MRLVTTWYGSFLLDEDGGSVTSAPFPKSIEGIAERLKLIREGEILDEERRVATSDASFHVTEKRLLPLDGAEMVDQMAPSTNVPTPESMGFDPSMLREASLLLATESIRDALPPDQPVILYLRAMDQVDRGGSKALEMLRYWHSFHFPELGALVDDTEFLRLLSAGPERDRILGERPYLDPGSDAGRPLTPGEGEAMAAMADHIISSRREAGSLRRNLEEAILEMAPNLAAVAGPLVGARLMSLAGSLDRLARLPSSTIQLLGAERALFMHIREGTPTPKHGVIFQHPTVHSSPPWLRGRMARALAGKIAIATRADAFGTHPDGDLGREMREQFLSRAQQLRSTHPEAPPGWRRRRPWASDRKRKGPDRGRSGKAGHRGGQKGGPRGGPKGGHRGGQKGGPRGGPKSGQKGSKHRVKHQGGHQRR
jgi:nucleolar protein 56